MAAISVTDVSTTGVTVPNAQVSSRFYACPWADTLASSDEVPLTSGDISIQRTNNPTFIETHNGGQIGVSGSTQYSQTVQTLGGADDTKVAELLVLALAASDLNNAKKGKATAIYGDGSGDRYLSYFNTATPAAGTSGAMSWTFNLSPFNVAWAPPS